MRLQETRQKRVKIENKQLMETDESGDYIQSHDFDFETLVHPLDMFEQLFGKA